MAKDYLLRNGCIEIFLEERKICLTVFLYFLIALPILGNDELNADTLANRLMYQTWSFPQEKVYVSTDRSAYVTGDTIRFRAFLVDASKHITPQLRSKYIYIELLNSFGQKVERLKIKEFDGMYVGILPIEDDLPEGNYTLCGYTQFMKNSGKDYFFRKTVPIFSQLANKYKLETTVKDGYLNVSLMDRFSGHPVRVENISVIGPESQFYAHGIKKRSSYSIRITNEMVKTGYVNVKFDKYEKFVPIPSDTVSLSLSIHPEGGYLIPGVKNKIAFKGIDKKGLSANYLGSIVDDENNHIIDLVSEHRGVGMVEFVPETSRRYFAVINQLQIPLPLPDSEATILAIDYIGKDSIDVQVLGRIRDDLNLIAHNGGIVTFAEKMQKQSLRLNRHELGSGIVQFFLVSDKCIILSSRMIFNRNGYIFSTSVESMPTGDYTVKAFRYYKTDSTTSIVSNLLLQSELKGYIEDPDYYFRKNDDTVDHHLDLLMLTQGWERYDYASALKGEFRSPEIALEIGGEISGTVKSRWRSKPLSDAIVMLIAPSINYAEQAYTDKEGRFVFKGMEWPENTTFVIQVFGQSGSKEHNFNWDHDEFPLTGAIEETNNLEEISSIIDERLLTAGTIMLDELVVTAPLSLEESRREMLSALGVRSISSQEMEDLHITTYEEILRKIPGLRVINGNILSSYARGSVSMSGVSGSNVEFWVDGVQWIPSFQAEDNNYSSSILSYSDLMNSTLSELSAMYPLHIIESIEYYRPSVAMVISGNAANSGGAIVLTTKDGSKLRDWDSDLFVRSFKPLGFQNQPETYQPHYIYDPTASEEKTYNAAWLPRITTFDSVPRQKDTYYEIEGIADGYMPVLVRAEE